MLIQNLFFYFFLTILIFECKGEDNIENDINEPENDKQGNNIKEGRSLEEIQNEYKINMDDMDTIMYCTLVIEEATSKMEKDIEKIRKKLKLKKAEKVENKIAVNILKECIKTDIKIVNKYMKDLVYLYPLEWDDSYNKYTKIDKKDYQNISDLNLTKEEKFLWDKYIEVNEFFKDYKHPGEDYFNDL